MNTSELASELPKAGRSSRRTVEAEFRLPKLDEIHLPEMNLEPIRAVAEQVLLTGIGAGVLAARGLTKAIRAARQAGAEAAQRPGSIAETLLGLVRKPEKGGPGGAKETRAKARTVPIDD